MLRIFVRRHPLLAGAVNLLLFACAITVALSDELWTSAGVYWISLGLTCVVAVCSNHFVYVQPARRIQDRFHELIELIVEPYRATISTKWEVEGRFKVYVVPRRGRYYRQVYVSESTSWPDHILDVEKQRGLIGLVIERNEPFFIDRVKFDDPNLGKQVASRFTPAQLEHTKHLQFICLAPIRNPKHGTSGVPADERIVGSLVFAHRTPGMCPSKEQIEQLTRDMDSLSRIIAHYLDLAEYEHL